MFAQESVMDIQRQAFQEWYIANHHDGDIHPNQQLLEWSEKGGFYFASSVEDLWEAWQAATAQAVPEGFVLVPKEPTDKTIAHMINTPIEVNLLCDHADTFLSEGEAYIAYKAMIEAQEPTND